MKNLSKLLERFSLSLNKDTIKKEFIAEVIRKTTKAALPIENISVKEGVLTIQAGSVLKNEIKLKEETILTELKERHGVRIARVLYK